MRPIDADALHEIRFTDIFNENVRHSKSKLYMLGWNDAIDAIIYDTPTIDVIPVRHAKWILKITKIGGIDWPSGMKCSGCGEDALNAEGIDFLTDFCPHCGARMDEE